ncbi:hypothetical protein L345_13335, partial [Ophiophagus hannah]
MFGGIFSSEEGYSNITTPPVAIRKQARDRVVFYKDKSLDGSLKTVESRTWEGNRQNTFRFETWIIMAESGEVIGRAILLLSLITPKWCNPFSLCAKQGKVTRKLPELERRTLSTSDDVEDREHEKARLEEAYEKCDRNLDELIVQHYNELMTAIGTYQSITERITTSRNKIKQNSFFLVWTPDLVDIKLIGEGEPGFLQNASALQAGRAAQAVDRRDRAQACPESAGRDRDHQAGAAEAAAVHGQQALPDRHGYAGK